MPLDGSGNYHYPPGTPGVPDTTIESESYNSFIDDLVNNDLNIARPITRGGTGGTDPTSALANLGGEKAQQIVNDYDTMVWLSGSFYSDNTTGRHAPVDGHRFVGVSITQDVVTQANVMLEAFDLDSTPTGNRYTRVKKDGVWGAWTSLTAFLDTTYVKKAGDQMTGDLTINKASPTFSLNSPTANDYAAIQSNRGAGAGTPRWLMLLGSGSESGTNGGNDFQLRSFDNAGAYIGDPFYLIRSNGNLWLGGDLNIGQIGSLGKASPQVFLRSTDGISVVSGYKNNVPRWLLYLGSGDTESTGNVGTNFMIRRFADNGALLDAPFWITRATGYVGLNTSNPQARLHVADPLTGVALRLEFAPGQPGAVEFFAAGNNVIGAVRSQTNANNQSGILTFNTALNGSLSEKMRIDINGNVGVGTTAPGVFVPAARTLSIMNAASNYGILEVGNLAAAAGGQGIGGIGFVAPNGIPSSWVNKAYGCILVNSAGGGGANGFGGAMLFYLKGDNAANWATGFPMFTLDGTALGGLGLASLVGDVMVTRADDSLGLIYFKKNRSSYIYGDGTNLYFYPSSGSGGQVWHAGNANFNAFVQQNRTVFVGDTVTAEGHNEPDPSYLLGGINLNGATGAVRALRWKVTQYYTGASGWVTAPGA